MQGMKRSARVRPPRDDLAAKLEILSSQFVTTVLKATRGAVSESPRTKKSKTTGKTGHRVRRLRTLQRAIEWQLQLETGDVGSRAEIAKREGISAAAVTQAMRVLDVVGEGKGNLPPMHVFRTSPAKTTRSEHRDFRKLRNEVLLQFETEFVKATLRAANGNISEAARLAKIDRKHFWRLMQRTGAR